MENIEIDDRPTLDDLRFCINESKRAYRANPSDMALSQFRSFVRSFRHARDCKATDCWHA